ncbi:hypothetical protein BFJ69_g10357 [Fusarium oxysporum]|uniref:Uncharacterized protein n=1 Tax=Fusarium oxysporum TaxID=5507 RepID=A0A420MVQ0_FUSOX|nr:hypothetical protein BFJ69_g10357 [Fusarium oxysporum]
MVYKLSIANKTIPVNAKAVGFEVAEVESGSFGVRDPGGKFVAVVAVVMSVVDTVLEIIDIVDVVEETKEMVDQLNGPIKQSYKDYFNGIRAASQ